jgi:hypothetical protein
MNERWFSTKLLLYFDILGIVCSFRLLCVLYYKRDSQTIPRKSDLFYLEIFDYIQTLPPELGNG